MNKFDRMDQLMAMPRCASMKKITVIVLSLGMFFSAHALSSGERSSLHGATADRMAAAPDQYTYECADGSASITLDEPPPYGAGSAYRDFFYSCGKRVLRGSAAVGGDGTSGGSSVLRLRSKESKL